jgi:DNA mismatch repair ATPase MutL
MQMTFKQVSKHFNEIFLKIVPQGTAHLVMRTNDNFEEEDRQRRLDRNPQDVTSVEEYTGVGIRVSFAGKTNEKLVPSSEETDILKIEGFVGKPEFAKKNRGEQFFFVNDRYIKSGYLHHAVMNAYEGILREGTQPSYFLYLTRYKTALLILLREQI